MAALPGPLCEPCLRARPPAVGEVRAWRTSKTEEFKLIEAPVWESGVPAGAMSIHLDPGTRYQEVLGFGAAMTDASCWLLAQLDAEQRRAILRGLFGRNGLRLSVARTTIGSSDYSLNAYSYDDSAQPDPRADALQHRSRSEVHPAGAARDAPGQSGDVLFLFAVEPAGVDEGEPHAAGRRHAQALLPAAYAEYIRRFLEGYAKNGVTIDAVTVQNEVDTDQDGRMPQALWGQEYEMEFVEGASGAGARKGGG